MCKYYYYMAFLISLTCSIIQAQDSTWAEGPELNFSRTGATAVSLNGEIYIIGGSGINGVILNSVEKLDPQSGFWDDTSIAPLIIPRLDAAAVVYRDSIYVIGGLNDSGDVVSEVEKYHPGLNAWIEVEDLNVERRGHAAVIINNTICVIGGKKDDGSYVETIEYLNDSGEEFEWEEISTEIRALRENTFSAAINNQFYTFGGIFNFPSDSSFIGQFQPNWSLNWLEINNLDIERGNGATAVVDNKIYLMGGITNQPSASDSVKIYDIFSNQLSSGPTLSLPRIGSAAASIGNQIYLMGGYDSNFDDPLSLVEVLELDSVVSIGIPNPNLPSTFIHILAYPNPFNGVVTIEIDLPTREVSTLEIIDITGRRIKTLNQGTLDIGLHRFQWDASNNLNQGVASGIYWAIIRGETFSQHVKLVYVK